jgi:phosphinothricin acetyltransferase
MAPAHHLIRTVTPADAPAICAIYNDYVAKTVISFEIDPVSVAEMTTRIREISRDFPWLVLEDASTLVGYAYANAWKTRAAYRESVETTIYLAPEYARRGIGTRLYQALIDELSRRTFHCAIGGIALPNPASVALHERLGFVKVAQFREVGRKFDRRIDVGYWELLLPDH